MRKALYLWCFLPCVPEIVLHLHFQPELGRRPQRGRKPERHSRRNPRMPVQDARQGRPRHAKPGRRLLNRHAAQIILQHFSGMRRVENHNVALNDNPGNPLELRPRLEK